MMTVFFDFRGVVHYEFLSARLVPKTLNFLEKSRRVDVCETMLSDYQDKLKCIITGDEYLYCIYAYDPETTDQSSEYCAKGDGKPQEHVKVVQKSS